jgi:predicted RNA-binding Zn ribbon-like protein
MPPAPIVHNYVFHHGRLSLSFAGTVGDRGSLATERLDSPGALAGWLEVAQLAPSALDVTPRAYRRALTLREAIARATAAVVANGKPAADDVARINDFAKGATARIALDPATLTIVDAVRDPLTAALGRIARDAIELLGNSEERARLRACGLGSCGSIFLTPAGRRERRWCSMARCGNRAKASAHRDRVKDAG